MNTTIEVIIGALVVLSALGTLYWTGYFLLNLFLDIFFHPKPNPLGPLCMLILWSIPLDTFLYVYG